MTDQLLESTQISAHGTAYQRQGRTDASDVVLIHGAGLDRRIWEPFLPLLTSCYRVVSYDLYGHGGSIAPPAQLSLSVCSSQLKELTDELGIQRCAIIGFSLGGMINRRFALDFPAFVRALVILNSPHQRTRRQQRLIEQRASDTAQGGPEATIEATMERWFTQKHRHANPAAVQQVRECVLGNDPVSYAQCRQVLATGVLELIRPAPAIEAPALVMTCEHDSGSTPAMSHAIASEIAGSEVRIVPELQHLGLIEDPQAFAAPIMDFLSRHI